MKRIVVWYLYPSLQQTSCGRYTKKPNFTCNEIGTCKHCHPIHSMADTLDGAAVCPAPSIQDLLLFPVTSVPATYSAAAGTLSFLSFLSGSSLWSWFSVIYPRSLPAVPLPSVSSVARICDLLTFLSVAVTCARMYVSPCFVLTPV